ncbi:MAG: hypothetical protein ACI9K1_002069 [Arcticibacterium sp.]|jgi:uncharacterized protein (DUF2141 family)
MKTLIITLLTFITFLPASKPETVTITISIEGIRNSRGTIGVALHNEASKFPDGEAFISKEISLSSSGSIEVVFENVPAGNYAIAIMHDENNSGEIDFNEYGMPLEGFCFSNEAMGENGPPDFGQASFSADSDTKLSSTLIYLL